MVNKYKGISATLVVMLLWGLLFPLIKLGMSELGISSMGEILTFAGIRFTICGLIITVFVFFKDKCLFTNVKNSIIPILLSGLFAIILHYGFTYIGLSMTDGSKTAIIKQFGAVFYICFTGLFFPEDKLTSKKIAGLILGIGGILAINLNSDGIAFHLGDLLIIAASFCTVFSNVISKKALKTVDPIVLTGISEIFGGIMLTSFGLILGADIKAVIPKTVDGALVFTAIITASIISYCLWFTVVKKENLSKLFIIKFSEPLFAAIFGFLLLGENIFRLQYLFAFILISLGITIANKV